MNTTSSTSEIELITFKVGAEEYCIDVQNVREIRGFSPATPIPHAPAHVTGVINLRGTVLPVIDLASLLGKGRTEPTERHVLVVIHDDTQMAGLLVDSVQETLKIPSIEMQATPKVGITPAEALIKAILPLDGRMLSQLIVERLLPQMEREAA